MRKGLVHIGNSLGIIVDRSVLSLLKLDENAVFDISTDGKRLILEPVTAARENALQAAVGEERVAALGPASTIRKRSSR